RGIAEITTAGANPLGVGYLTDSTGAFWSFYVDSSGLKLKRSANADAIDPSVLLGAIPITSTTDLFTLDPGIYYGDNVTPVNGPAINSLPTTNYFWVKLEAPKANVSVKKLTWTDNGDNHYANDYYGAPSKWHNWQVPNSGTMATKSDVTTAVSAVNANMVHRNPDTGVVSEPVDFTKLTVEGGKSVATSDDLKSVIDNSWLPIKIADGWTSTPVLMKYDKTNGKTIITGMMSKPFGVSDGTCTEALLTLPDGFYWNEVDNSMIGINQANILEATINPDNKKELIVSYKWKWSSPASGNAFVGYNEAYSIGSDEKVTGTYYETTSISQA
ncbi:hypothetical protein, partial [Levilactobacillus brevis]|uniref:hypothetical protein n=1 Tax=Levilactobacillus brevis TaxID=1580 RepID=UPI002073BE4A